MKHHITIEEAKTLLGQGKPSPFIVLLKHGSMQVEYFAPREKDNQQPHSQDEIYVIASGDSVFFRNSERLHCKTGDVLFVPAGTQHCFENFSADFATWVIFYGREGGEEA